MLIELANAQGRLFTARISREEKKALGQFMTPVSIARFMAKRLVADVNLSHVRVLEPSAGGGILAAAVVEELLAKPVKPDRIELQMFELDARLLPGLRELASKMSELCGEHGVLFDWNLTYGDFLLSELATSGQPVDGLLTIANPPFFKISKSKDARAKLHAYAIHGQPNIYGLFMAACARLTPPNGRWCFITPRSWMAGSYFKAVRHAILRHLSIECLHAFESRTEGFEEDSVLQETVISWARGRKYISPNSNITLTCSKGASDLESSTVRDLPTSRIVGDDELAMFSLPSKSKSTFEGWGATLRTYGLEVSTGPVVAFRASNHIQLVGNKNTVPLLWLQHIGQQVIRWPIKKKREHIESTAESAWMLVKNQPMIIMRRFSPKEDQRRVTCAPYGIGKQLLPGKVLGLENHLNYIHRPGGSMTEPEVIGLSAFLASHVVDDYFRAIAGSTQVNATELRKLPLPPLPLLIAIGEKLPTNASLADIDAIVDTLINAHLTVQPA